MSSGGISKNVLSLLGIYISKSGRAIMAVESSEHPRIAANSSIKGHISWLFNLNTWSLVSQNVVAACRKAVSIFRCWKDCRGLLWKDYILFQSFPLRLLRKVFISWREAWVMMDLEGNKIYLSFRSFYRHKVQSSWD